MKNKKWLSALVGLVLVLALGFTVVACESDTTGGDDGGRGGCSGTVTAVSFAAGLPVLAGACVCLVLARKKRS